MAKQEPRQRLRVLIVEDDEIDAEMMVACLTKGGFEPEWRRVASKADYISELEAGADVILGDYSVPGFGAIEALRELQSRNLDIPFIIVSGTVGEELAVEALRQGAADYVLKDRMQRLGDAVARALDQRRLRLELGDAEQRYRSMFEDNPSPMWVYDLETLRFLAVNDAAVVRYGYTREEFLAMTLREIRPAEDVAELTESVATTVGRGFKISGEYRHRTKDGTVIDVRIESHGLTHSGRHARIVLATDITDRKRAEAALLENEERTRFALEAGGVGIWDADQRTGKVVWSQTLAEMHGLAPGTFDGTFEAFIEMIHPDDRIGVLAAIQRSQADETDANIEYRTVWPDGSTHWIAGKGRSAHQQRMIGVGLDVTNRKQLEAQLVQSQKMEAVGQLAGGVAHDFNNLLTAILGYTELLLPAFKRNDRRARDLDQIRKAATRATNLTRQLLAFSRRQILQPAIVDLNALVTDLANMLRRLIGEDIELSLQLDSPLGRVKADPGQIEQVILNLAVNARDAMPRGGLVTIETANLHVDREFFRRHGVSEEGATHQLVVLAFSDTGIGMDADTRKRIFEPFFTTKPKGKGTGLGLSMVYGIVKQSGGFVWVYSEPGQGTTFKVYLPQTDEEPDEEGLAPTVELRATGTETILLVEDEEAVRTLSRELLERKGYRVIDAQDAEEALLVAEKETGRIDLLLSDVVMPGESGPELFERLSPLRPDMKVVYVSGYTDEAFIKRGIITPGTPFLQKPFTAAGLTRKIREVLDGGRR